ncbi:Translin-associated factor X-interacting protein 1 [Oryzias melastigma]|uniref:Translin-associated factor X-interacting protein 1 n=1 Tax=Oryzias melastigma TaxID=30732 RepID=A0A834FK94_ORYME|nr:Translin-associated factor X-interacting protein 1 [Oryzias melastigma]
MSLHRNITLPPLNQTEERGSMNSRVQQKNSEGIHDSPADFDVEGQLTTKLCWSGSSYLYAGPGRKPELLRQLERHVNEELCAISSQEPKFEELRLQVYRNVFDQFISAFTTYQPLLCTIKKEYDNIIVDQQDQIQKLAPLQSQLRLVTEECERKIRAQWKEQHTEIETLKREKQQLQRDAQSMKEAEKNTQTVVDRLRSELSQQYLQYREEHDARQLLIRQLNDLTRASVMNKRPAVQNKDFQELQRELEACREELRSMKAEYRDAVPLHDWDALQQTHQRTVLQLKTLQGDFKLMKSEYDILLELHKSSNLQPKDQVSTSMQTEENVEEEPETKPEQLHKLINLCDPKEEPAHESK